MSFRNKRKDFFLYLGKIDIDLIFNNSYYIFKEKYILLEEDEITDLQLKKGMG